MQITKFGQCCLLIEVSGKRILTDPGRFSVSQNEVTNIDLILITHEHADHLHTESLQSILENNPKSKVITNKSVSSILTGLGVSSEVLTEHIEHNHHGITLETFPGKHEEIFEDYGQVENTGFFIANELFYPGDSYTEPGKPVPLLALPIAGPWCKLSDAVTYAIKVNPTKAFPVHDATLNSDGLALTHGLFTSQLQAKNIAFTPLINGETKEF